MSEHFCLKWNDHMEVMKELKNLLSLGIMVDVTLACDGQSLKAHKIVLSACSPFFKSLFLENPCKHPIVILKDVKFAELKAVIDFMYCGEVNVAEEKLPSLIKTAQTLRVKGLGEDLPECLKNDRSNFEYKNQSEDELSNPSECTVDTFINETAGKMQTQTDQNENFEPEIKQELLFDDTNDGAPYRIAATVSLSSIPHSSNFSQKQLVEQNYDQFEENLQDSTQNSIRQSDDFPAQSFESFPQSTIQQHQNCPGTPSSSISETLTYVYPSNTLTVDNQQPGTFSMFPNKILQNKKELKKIPAKRTAEKISPRKSVRNSRKPKVFSDDEDSGSIKKRKLKFHKCGTCTFKSLHLKDLISHYRATAQVEETGKIQYNEHTYAHASHAQLKQHIQPIRQKEGFYHCSLCTYETNWKNSLKKHFETIHEGKRKKPFKCEKCDFHAACKGTVKRHMITKHGEKPFKCEKCDFHSGYEESIKGHMITIHEKRKELTCPHCSYGSHKKAVSIGIYKYAGKKNNCCMILETKPTKAIILSILSLIKSLSVLTEAVKSESERF